MFLVPDFNPMLDERRPGRRRRVLLGGVVSPLDRGSSFSCMIRDIADGGARLFGRGRIFPAEFHLIHLRNRIAYRSRVVWTRGPEVGVSFDRSFALGDISDPGLDHLTQLWLLHARTGA